MKTKRIYFIKLFDEASKIRYIFDLWRIYYEYRIGKVIKKLEIHENDVVIDFRCEDMRFKKYINGVYIEVDKREPRVKRGYFIKCDLDKEFPKIIFNKGICILIIELLKRYNFFIKMISKYVVDGGKILIVIPNYKSEHYRYWRLQDIKKKNSTSLIQNYITTDQLEKTLLQNNFKIIEKGGIFPYPYSKGYMYPFF